MVHRALRPGVSSRRAVLALAGAVVLLRLPFLVAPEGNDEGGYLAVAHQWHRAGSSLYGQYWVDRPPVLIALFQLADLTGGLPALRVLGAAAAALTTLGAAAAAGVVAGSRAAVWTAAVTAVLLSSPQLGTLQVNGELLAAPFVAWSIAGAAYALTAEGPRAHRAAAGAGALAVAAVLVKQNMIEPVVFATVLALLLWRAGRLPVSRLRRLVVAGVLGTVGMLAVAAAWTVAHGTSLVGVFDAMYAFRIRAADVLATAPDPGQAGRSASLVKSLFTSGLVLVPVLLLWWAVRRRTDVPAVWALLATLSWSGLSIFLGGGYWDHYLIELVVPVGLAVGVLVDRAGVDDGAAGRWAAAAPRLVGAAVIVASLAHWVGGQAGTGSTSGVSLGTAIGRAARPGDTVVSAVGDAQVVEVSGLRSPYPYLWTLPAQVEDPGLDRLVTLLRGPRAPTWLVTWDRPTYSAAARDRLAAAVAEGYRSVAVVCHHAIYLRKGVDRPAVHATGPCHGPSSIAARAG